VIGGGLTPERARSELPERSMGVDEAIDARLALACCSQRDARARLHVRPLERRVDFAKELERLLELLGGPRGVVFHQRHLAEGVRERGERFRAGEPTREIGRRPRARTHERDVAAACRKRRDPSQRRRVLGRLVG
jgi:hypothetical protein